MKNELAKRFGDHRVHEIPVKEGEVPLLLLDLELNSPVSVLVTNGLRTYTMPVPDRWKGREHVELYFCLPSYWEWDDLEDPQRNWVYYWIQRLAKYVVEKETWFGPGHTMPCGAEMKPLSATMKQNHFMLSEPILLEREMESIKVDGEEVYFLAIIPIFPDELDYKLGKGTLKLTRKFIQKGVSEKLDDFRSTVLKSKWRLRR